MSRVLFITNYYPGGGDISSQVDLLRKYLNEEHVEASVFSTKGNVWRRLKAYFLFIVLMKVGWSYFKIGSRGLS